MKKETYQDKLNKLLGITDVANEIKAKQERKRGKIQGITEDEIQEFRSMQGIIYFLQAPELFTPKVCPHCGENFLVSRLYVKYCSYTCIRKSLNEQGFEWRKSHDIELLIKETYEGNEPLWIKNLPNLMQILSTLMEKPFTPVEQSSQEKLWPTPLKKQPITLSRPITT